MKKIFLVLLSSVMLTSVGIYAKDSATDDIRKERAENAKLSKKELNEKASKSARKEAKQLKKDGWKASPGALPIEKQLDRTYMMQFEFGDDMMPKYIMGEAMSTGNNYDAAKMQALELAKQNLAGQIQTEITTLIENTVSNEQLTSGDTESIARSVAASKNLITQSIGRTLTVMELYRDMKNGKKEVMVRIAYDTQAAMKAAKKALRKSLEERGDDLHNQLDELF